MIRLRDKTYICFVLYFITLFLHDTISWILIRNLKIISGIFLFVYRIGENFELNTIKICTLNNTNRKFTKVHTSKEFLLQEKYWNTIMQKMVNFSFSWKYIRQNEVYQHNRKYDCREVSSWSLITKNAAFSSFCKDHISRLPRTTCFLFFYFAIRSLINLEWFNYMKSNQLYRYEA